MYLPEVIRIMLQVSYQVLNPGLAKVWKQRATKKVDLLDKAIRYSALAIYNGARDKCPVVTANLRDSISIKYYADGPKAVAFIFSNVEYASDQEYSESYNHFHKDQKNPNAQFGFFRKSLAEEGPNFESRVKEILEKN
jgi:hypothetical protein